MATGIAEPGIRTKTPIARRAYARPRFVFSVVLVIALFASATSAFGVPTVRYTRVSVSGNTYALAGLALVDSSMYGLLGESTNDGSSWSFGMAPGAFWGATAWGSGPVWGSMTSNRGLWTGATPAVLEEKSPPAGPTYEWRDVATDGPSVIAVGERKAIPYGETAQPATIWTSTNNGDTWTETLLAPNYGPTNPGDPVPAQPSAILEAVDATAGAPGLAVAVGTEYQQGDFNRLGTVKASLVYSSTDGGSTWTTRTAGISTLGIQLRDVDVVSSTVAWAVGSNRRVLRTTDGGANWQNWTAPQDLKVPQNLGATTYEIMAVAGIDDTHAYICGSNGKIGYVSGDPGVPANWSFFTVPGLPALSSIAARDAANAIAVGDGGLTARTTSGMGSWTAKTYTGAPTVSITGPTGGFTLDGSTVHVAGTSADAVTGLGVAQVQVRIKRSDARYWDGDSWESAARWLPASTANSWAMWGYDWTDDGSSQPGTHTIEFSARAINANGGVSAISPPIASAKSSTSVTPIVPATVPYTGVTIGGKVLSKTGQPILGAGTMSLSTVSGTKVTLVKSGIVPNASGVYSYVVKPINNTRYRWTYGGNTSFNGSSTDFYVTPQVRLYAPKATRSSTTFTVTTYVSPRHSSRAVRVYAYRYASGKWSTTPYKWAYATAYTYTSTTTRMVAKIGLPRGTYRFRAYAPADTAHAYTWSSYSTTYKY
jgi:hypothetical protein